MTVVTRARVLRVAAVIATAAVVAVVGALAFTRVQASLEQGRRLAGLIPGARLEVLPTAGHIPAIEAGTQFDAALIGFLQETMPLRSAPVSGALTP